MRRPRGQVLALAAVVMTAMVGLLAFVVDAGMFFMARQELQKAADAGAIAAMIDLIPDPTDGLAAGDLSVPSGGNRERALATAELITRRNMEGIATRLCTSNPPEFVTPTPRFGSYISPTVGTGSGGLVYTVTVTVRCTAGYSFGRILGLLSMPISATGTAAIGSIKSLDCPAPYAIEAQDYRDPVTGAVSPPNAENNYGYGWGEFVSRYVGPASDPSADAILLCLNGDTNCGASLIGDWVAGDPCVPIEAGDTNLYAKNSASRAVGRVLDGYVRRFARGFPAGTENLVPRPPPRGANVLCPDGNPPTPPNVSDPDAPSPQVPPTLVPWSTLDGAVAITSTDPITNWRARRNSNCLTAFPALTPDSVATLRGGGNAVTVLGFAVFYASAIEQAGGGFSMRGYFVRPPLFGQLGGFRPDGNPIFRPIR